MKVLNCSAILSKQMIARILPLLFLVSPIIATVNEALRLEFLSGYRNDRLHWHLQKGGEGLLTYSELYRDIEFWENGLVLRTIHRDLVFLLKGCYAAVGRGDLFQRYADLPNEPRFQFDTHGWASDALGYFGYAANLTADRIYKTILIPLAGFSAHFEHIRRKGGRPDPAISELFSSASLETSSLLPGSLHSTWYGFFLGAGWAIEPGGRLNFRGGYSYHWLSVRFKTQYANVVSYFNPNLSSEEENSMFLKAKGNGNIGQTGWGQIDYIFSPVWQAGLGAQIHYFSTSLVGVHLHQQTHPILPQGNSTWSSPSRKCKVRWTSISGWFSTSRQF